MYDFGEACPVSMATSVLAERWTLQIIRELFLGSTKFSEFQKFMPNISPSLLKSRLNTLEESGIILKKKSATQGRYEYHLTSSGKALGPVLSEIGKWGMRFACEGMSDKQNTIHGFMRDISGRLDIDELPSCDIYMQFTFKDPEGDSKQYINIQKGVAQVCGKDLGFDIDIYISSTLRHFTKIWYGDLSIRSALEDKKLSVVGDNIYTDSLTKWMRISKYKDGNPQFIAPEY